MREDRVLIYLCLGVAVIAAVLIVSMIY